MSGHLGTVPVPQAVMYQQSFDASAGQTAFSTRGYQPGYLQVFLDGVLLEPAFYTATNGIDIVLGTGAPAGSDLTVWTWLPFEAAMFNQLNANVDMQTFALGLNNTRLSDAGISFDAGANTLDAYERGNWTPTVDGVGQSPNTPDSFSYIRVGDLVMVTADFTIAGVTGNHDDVGGLPYVPYANYSGTVNVPYCDGYTGYLGGITSAGSNVLNLFGEGVDRPSLTNGHRLIFSATYIAV